VLYNKPIQLYPNPANTCFSVQSDTNVLAVTIYTIAGKNVKTVTQPNAAIDVSDLASGVYLVKVKTINGTITKRLLKSN